MDTVYLDLETTGLGSDDEILEIGILDDGGKVLLDSLVRPVRHAAWPEAQAINGIAPEDVEHAPILDSIRPLIVEAVRNKRVVIYNADFDTRFLPYELRHAACVECCMLTFAGRYGEWRSERGDYQWKRLVFAAEYVLHQWQGTKHRALHDCMATRSVWRYLTDKAERARIDAARIAGVPA
ncbi:MAG: 3'-5' exonuclease [Gammaproteobacteria bacterium]|nr:3'-5' exonuclease [Gammaproteobacteria bacterium]